MEKYIIHGADILSFDPARAYLSGHALQVEDGIITKIAPCDELKDEHCEFIDASGNGDLAAMPSNWLRAAISAS